MRKLIWSIAFVVLAGFTAHSQSCGWSDTLLIANNTSTSLTLSISDYFNNDLSDPLQGLCGVEINFAHQFVDNLEIRLTSPAGQTVNLIGPNTDAQFEFTFFARWRIQFLPCSENPVPDFPSADGWNNNQINNFVNGGLYTGSYYPFIGCLENFNTGPVNGDWTFSITNLPSNYGGAITYVRLYFCDSRGVDCCFAEPGVLTAPHVLACENDTSLLINPLLTFPALSSDTLEYAYTYLLGRDGIYLDTTLTPDFRTFPAGNYEVCGLAYRRTEFDSIPLPNGLLTLDSIRNNLASFTPWACATLTDTCLQVTIVAPPDTTFLNQAICEGEAVQIGDSTYTQTGLYTNSLLSYAGCDSIVQLNLNVTPISRLDFDVVICEGDTFRVGSRAYTLSGLYIDTLSTVALGCDSIIELSLTVLPPVFYDSLTVICQGESFVLADSSFTQPGLYQVPLLTNQGCDSIIRIDLRVLNPQVFIQPPDTLTCANAQVVLSGNAAPALGSFTYRWLNLAGATLAAGSQYSSSEPGFYILEATQSLAGRSCSTRDTIEIIDGRIRPDADAGAPQVVSCSSPIATLNGAASSSGPDIRYLWSTSNGSLLPPINQPNTRAGAGGDYQLIVTNIVSGCRDTASVTVSADTLPPLAQIAGGFTLSCSVLADTLNGTASSSGPDYRFIWSGPCVQPIATDERRIEANCPGWYFLLVEDQRNGCTAVDSALVTLNRDLPEAVAAAVLPLTCSRLLSPLDAAASEPSGLLEYSWQGPGLVGNPNASAVGANQAGTYQLVVTRTDNDCRDTLLVNVPIDTLAPIADAGGSPTLSCRENSVLLNGPTTSRGPRFTYAWFDTSGPLGVGTDSLRVSMAGQYQLVVQDTVNGCSAQDVILVGSDFNPPPINAGPDQDLACASAIITLSGDETLFTGPVSLQWSGPCLLGPANEWTVEADCPGQYALTVTRLDNGCSRTDVVQVSLLNDATVAVLPDTVALSCETGAAIISTAGSSQGVVSWFRDGAQIGLPFPDPEVSQTGLYTLVVTNFDNTCSDTAQVVVVVGCEVEASAIAPDTLNCQRQSVLIDGSASSVGPNISYQWLEPAPGCIIGAANTPLTEVVCGGDYRLVVTQNIVGITDTFVLSVAIDTLSPLSVAGIGDTITCSQTRVSLNGSASAQGPNIVYRWMNSLDEMLSTSLILTNLDEPGVYILEVIDTANGCRGVSQTIVRRDDNVPVIAFGSDVFPCLQDTFSLQAFVTPSSPDYLYQWTGPSIRSGANELSALIDTLGDYTFSVIDPFTGCADTASVNVRGQLCVPCLSLVSADTLNCVRDVATIEAAFCLDCPGCVVQWFDENGPIMGQNTLSLSVSSPGDYYLIATDTLGFSSQLNAVVESLTYQPIADAGPDRLITCDSLTLSIGGALTDVGPGINYQWQALGGAPITDANRAVARVNLPDTYILRVFSTLSECFSLDTVVVQVDTLRPIAEAGPNASLSCQQGFVGLNGAGSSTGQLSYLWTGPAANCLNGELTLNPVASCPGLYTLQVVNNLNGCEASDTVRVLPIQGLPALPQLADTSLTCLVDTIAWVTPDAGPGNNYLIRWCPLDSNGEVIAAACVEGLNFEVSQPGLYQYSLTDTLSGCSQSITFEVDEIRNLPPAQAGPDADLSCTQDSLLLQALAGPYQYAWLPNGGPAVSNPDSSATYVYAPGLYVLQVTDPSNGCVAIDSVLISLDDDAPMVFAGADTLINCTRPQLRLQATSDEPLSSLIWQWQSPDGQLLDGVTSSNPLVGSAGWYIVTATAPNGCTATDSLLVLSDFRPPTALVANLDSLSLNCVVDTLSLDASASLSVLGQGLSYQWLTSAPGRVFPSNDIPLTFTDRPGLYRLVVTELGNGCRDTLTFNISLDRLQPQLSINAPMPLTCEQLQTTLQGQSDLPDSLASYRWFNEAGDILATTQTLLVSEPGLYILEVTNLRNGCTNRETTQVTANQEPPLARIAEPEQLGCNRNQVTLDGSASSRGSQLLYQWATLGGQLSGQTDSLYALASRDGLYWLVVTDTLTGCSAADTVQVSTTAEAIRGIELSIIPPDCFGSPTGDLEVTQVDGGVPPYSYALAGSTFTISPFFEDVPVGSYVVVVRDAQGCTWEEPAQILPPSEIDIDLGPDLSIELGDSARLEAIINLPAYDTIIWQSVAPIPNVGELVQVVKPTETVFYLATIIDEKGCLARDTVLVRVIERSDVYIPTIFSPNGDNSNDIFTIYAGQQVALIRHLSIYDRWGNQVFERNNFAPNDPNQGWDGNFEGRPMNAAVFVYYLEIERIDGKVSTLKGDLTLMR